MIIAKTDMAEMPDTCRDCTQYYDGLCQVKGWNAMISATTGSRPSWCPLEEVKEKDND